MQNDEITALARRIALLEHACRRALNCFAIVSQTDGLDMHEQTVYDLLKQVLDEPGSVILHHVPKEPEPPEGNVVDFTTEGEIVRIEEGNVITYQPGDPNGKTDTNGL